MDIIIKNGHIIDGAGNPWYKADIGIVDEKIVKIRNLEGISAEITIDANELIVCPGFIDIHSHADATILVNPKQESAIRQGITTHVAGNCGYSLAPINPERKDLFLRYLGDIMPSSNTLKIDWTTHNQYLKKVEEISIASNMMFLVGHGVVRIAVMGYDDREPTDKELEDMKNYIAEAMESGALGLSTGLLYPPGIFSKTQELIELAKVVAKYGGYYFSHLRAYGPKLMKSVKEAIKIGEKANLPVQISHIMVVGKPFWGSSERVLKVIEKARLKNLEINIDLHPYDSVMTDLSILLPPWALEGGKDKTIERLKDPITREKIKHDMINGYEGWDEWFPIEFLGWENLVVIMLSSEKYSSYEAKSVKEIAELTNGDIYSTLYDILIEGQLDPFLIITNLKGEADIVNFMKSPLAAFETDSFPTAPYGELGKKKTHPRGYGSYPKILGEFVREKQILTLESAIRKMTSLPAQMIGLLDRGLIRPNNYADIVIFNPDTIIDKGTYANPHQYPEGIEYVIVNGNIVVQKGEHTGNLPGKVLRHRK